MKKAIKDLQEVTPAITPAKPVNPMTTEKTVPITPKTRRRLDTLQDELEQALAPLRQKMAEVQQLYVNRMTDTVAGYLDGLGVEIDLNLDTVARTEDGGNLKITYARPVKSDVEKPVQPEKTEAADTAEVAEESK